MTPRLTVAAALFGWIGKFPQHKWPTLLHLTAAMLWGIALTILFHRYTVFSGFDLVQADTGDSRLVASVLEHWFQVFSGINDWRSPPWFFPKQGTLAYSDILFGMALPYSLFRTSGVGVFVAMNLTLVLLSFLSYAACLWLLRVVLAFNWFAATVGAAFFAFNYPKFAALPHVKLRFDMLQPVILGLLLSLLSGCTPSARRTFITCCVAALAFAMLASTTFLNAWFLLLLLLVSLPVTLLDRDLRPLIFSLLRHRWLPALGGLFLGSLALLPLIQLYTPALAETGAWPWPEVLRTIPWPAQLIWMGTDSYGWGWLAARWPDLNDANRPEMRLGYGAAATLAWVSLIGLALLQVSQWARTSGDRQPSGHLPGQIVRVLTLASLIVILLGVQIDGHSPWYVVYKLFPGGVGVRSVSRYVLTLSLPLAIGLGFALEMFLAKPRSKLASVLVAGALLAIAGEQLAAIDLYSASTAERFDASVARLIDRRCTAFYLKPARKYVFPERPIDIDSVSERTFDVDAYLAANEDVAQNWKGSAWEHFIAHGRREHRNLSPTEGQLNFDYQITASLAALITGIPTINGIGAKLPFGWDLMGVFGPNIGERANDWLRHNDHGGSACLVAVDFGNGEIPVRMPSGFIQIR